MVLVNTYIEDLFGEGHSEDAVTMKSFPGITWENAWCSLAP